MVGSYTTLIPIRSWPGLPQDASLGDPKDLFTSRKGRIEKTSVTEAGDRGRGKSCERMFVCDLISSITPMPPLSQDDVGGQAVHMLL